MAKSQRTSLLEDGFFLAQSSHQLQAIKAKADEADRAAALAECSGIDDEEVLIHLVGLDIAPETLSAMTLVPLVAVAWADGSIADRERGAVLEAASVNGVEAGTPAHELLEAWLARKPPSDLIDAWKGYVDELLEQLPDGDRVTLHEKVMGRARRVAEAAGGFLGLATISGAEERVLDELDEAFHAS